MRINDKMLIESINHSKKTYYYLKRTKYREVQLMKRGLLYEYLFKDQDVKEEDRKLELIQKGMLAEKMLNEKVFEDMIKPDNNWGGKDD